MSRSQSNSALHPIEASHLQARRERVFLILAGLFLGSLTMLNILGISRFIVLFSIDISAEGWNWKPGQWGQYAFALAVGVLPYPVTFLCTDLISEFYGRRRANWVVTVGLVLNVWVVFVLWIGGVLPATPKMDSETNLPTVELQPRDADTAKSMPPAEFSEQAKTYDEELKRVNEVYKANIPGDYAFYNIRMLTFGAVVASMIAYMCAQFTDVYMFHFWKRLTNGRWLWLRNNGSTMVSQLVDTVAVILITHFYAQALPLPPEGRDLWTHLFLFIATGYFFKFGIALLDTIPIYIAVAWLREYLQFDPITETDLSLTDESARPVVADPNPSE